MTNSQHILDAAQWQQLKQVFEQVVGLPEDERQQLLRKMDLPSALRNELDLLLAHASETTSTLLQAAQLEISTSNDLQNLRLGAWQLIEKIGAGGMGDVYRARRIDGRYQGESAVKVLRASHAADIVQRFASEQQALASLNHPHIARILDAGQSSDGVAYFVMELVEGQSIDRACQGQPLTQRLRLFEQLLQAVAHAHARLLIHRDLKPSNVMVDQSQQVKLLDFGIAKALDPMQAVDTQTTLQEQRVLTPAYSSPEQIRGEPVTTASDIYSLGVLLYGLLTGKKPYGRNATTPAEAAQAVLTETPEAPSTTNAGPSDQMNVAIEPALLQGDLDNIVLKALQKDPDARYRSVDAFAADIRAYLDGYPVSARPPSWRYLIGKWIRRHRIATSLSALALIAILASSVIALRQAHQADQARRQAQENLERLKSITRAVLYRVGNQIENLPGGIEIRFKMTKDLIDDLEKLANLPDADPALQEDLAQAWVRLAEMQADNQNRSLQQNDAALESAKRAIYWFERTANSQYQQASFAVGWGEAWRAVSNVARAKSDIPTALNAQQQRLTILQEADRRFPHNEHVLHALASSYLNRGQLMANDAKMYRSAEQELQRAQRKFQELVHLHPQDSASYHQLGVSYGAQANLASNQAQWDSAMQASELAVRNLQKATELKPQNIAHLAGLANESNAACSTAVLLQDKAGMSMCDLSWQSYLQLLKLEPDSKAWRIRRAFGAIYSASALAQRGDQAGAKARLQLVIADLAQYATAERELNRLAYLKVDLADLDPKSARELLKATEQRLIASTVESSDQTQLLWRARWFEVAAKYAEKGEARNDREQALQAYAKANQLQALGPLYQDRWKRLQ